SPRSTILGHAIGVTAGYLSLLATGLAASYPYCRHYAAARDCRRLFVGPHRGSDGAAARAASSRLRDRADRLAGLAAPRPTRRADARRGPADRPGIRFQPPRRYPVSPLGQTCLAILTSIRAARIRCLIGHR